MLFDTPNRLYFAAGTALGNRQALKVGFRVDLSRYRVDFRVCVNSDYPGVVGVRVHRATTLGKRLD